MKVYAKVPVNSEILESIIIGPIQYEQLADIPSSLLVGEDLLPENQMQDLPLTTVMGVDDTGFPYARWRLDSMIRNSDLPLDGASLPPVDRIVFRHPFAVELTAEAKKIGRKRPIVVNTTESIRQRLRVDTKAAEEGLRLVQLGPLAPRLKAKPSEADIAHRKKVVEALQDGRGKILIQVYEVKCILCGLERVTQEWLDKCGFSGITVKYWFSAKASSVDDLLKLVKAYERDRAPWSRMLSSMANGRYGSSFAMSAITAARAAVKRHKKSGFKPKTAVEKKVTRILRAIARK